MKRFAAFALCVSALLLPAALQGIASESEWDQARATALARDMAEPIAALRADLEGRPPVPGKEAAHAAVLNAVKDLQSSVTQLAERLASGAGRAETVALFGEVRAREQAAAKRTWEYPAPFDMHPAVDRLDLLTKQLGRYYGTPPSGEGPR